MSITSAISQTLQQFYSHKIVHDFHQYLDEEEYDSEVLRDDLKDDEPLFLDYIINENPAIFAHDAQQQQLMYRVKHLSSNEQALSISDAKSIDIERDAKNGDNDKFLNHDDHDLKQQDYQQHAPQIAIEQNESDQDQWPCEYCTFINDEVNSICSVCNKPRNKVENSAKAENIPFEVDEKWNCVYKEIQDSYLNEERCNKYYTTFIDLINKHKFAMDDAEEDLNEFAVIKNESIIAEGIIDRFGWKQTDINTSRLIDCLKSALAKQRSNDQRQVINDNNPNEQEAIFQINDDDSNDDSNHHQQPGVHEVDSWKTRIAVIIGLRHDSKHNKKLAKFNLFAKALSIFGQRELCCLLRLWIRQKMVKSSQAFNDGMDIIKFMRYRFDDKSQEFNGEDIQKIFKMGFHHKLMGHNSILRKLDPQNQVSINIKLIQIWMAAIVMKMNQYFVKYKSCHSIFCLRFLNQSNDEIQRANNNEMSIFERVQHAFKLLEESEKEMISDDCWIFVIDFTKLNKKQEPEIYFESREVFDDEKLTERRYNADYKLNQLYHVKKLDYMVSKENDNTAMSLQVSFHKYWTNNCISWLTHSSGHVPFFEDDIVQFIPKLFQTSPGAMNDDEWEEIVERGKITEIKSMDRMYSELEQSFENFMNRKDEKE